MKLYIALAVVLMSGYLKAQEYDSMPEQFQCFTNVMEEASISNGLEELWSETQLQLQFYIDHWKKCTEAGNEIYIVRNTKALQEYMRGIRAKCGVETLDEVLEILFDNVSNSPGCFVCIANSIGEVWTHYKMSEMWRQFYPQLRLHFDEWKKCAEDQNVAKSCNAKESRAIYTILNDCVALMSSMNPKISIDFGDMVQQRCAKCQY